MIYLKSDFIALCSHAVGYFTTLIAITYIAQERFRSVRFALRASIKQYRVWLLFEVIWRRDKWGFACIVPVAVVDIYKGM